MNRRLTTLDGFGMFTAWILILGTLISYTPQYYKIYKNKNTHGISESMLIFGIYSSYLNVLGTIQENLYELNNCGDNCFNNIIPIIQLFSPCLCAIIFYIFYIIYYVDENSLELESESESISNVRKKAFTNFIIILLILIYFFISINFNYNFNNNSGKILNIFSTIFSLIMWLPQIYKTYKLKDNQTLSLVALLIHSIGCLITIIYQSVIIMQPIWIILCYIVGFLSESSILIMSLYFKYQLDNTSSLYEKLIN